MLHRCGLFVLEQEFSIVLNKLQFVVAFLNQRVLYFPTQSLTTHKNLGWANTSSHRPCSGHVKHDPSDRI